jgi:hypothetical protein
MRSLAAESSSSTSAAVGRDAERVRLQLVETLRRRNTSALPFIGNGRQGMLSRR